MSNLDIAFDFPAVRRRPWWRRLIQSLGRLGRALAAMRRSRALASLVIGYGDLGCSPRGFW
jgi:hypothetical protein